MPLRNLEQMIEEKYGYVRLSEPDGTNRSGKRGNGAVVGADYGVPAYVDARRRFQFIDNWFQEVHAATERDRPFILKDGIRIRERWRTIAGTSTDRGTEVAARVAVDELTRRIRSAT